MFNIQLYAEISSLKQYNDKKALNHNIQITYVVNNADTATLIIPKKNSITLIQQT